MTTSILPAHQELLVLRRGIRLLFHPQIKT